MKAGSNIFFMCLFVAIHAWRYCFPVISVDGATLKNQYFGTLLSACTVDENSQIVPLAFSIVDSENDASGAWFFRNLKSGLGEHNELVIVSDGHLSIPKGVSNNYDTAEHGLCAFHLLKNIKKDTSQS